MEGSVVIFGALSFAAESEVESWKTRIADPSEHRDWKGDLRRGETEPRPVADLLGAFAAFASEKHPPGRVEVKVRPTEVSVRGYLDDDGTAAWGKLVLSAFRAAAGAGAKGRLFAVQPQGAFGYAVDVEPGASRLSTLPLKDLGDLLDTPAAREALALFWERFPKIDLAALEGIAAHRAPASGGTAAYSGLVDAITKAPPARVLAAAKDLEKRGMGLVTLDPKSRRPTAAVVGRRDLERITELWPTAAALIAGLREGATGEVRAIAVRLAAAVASGGVDAVAALLATRPEAEVVQAAADELAQASYPEASRLLLDLVREPPAGVQGPSARAAAAAAIGRAGDARARKELNALLTPAVVASADGSALAHTILDAGTIGPLRLQPEVLVALWSAAVDPQVRDRLYRLLLACNDRDALAQAAAHARTDAERRDLETARKRAKPSKKPAAKKAAAKPTAKPAGKATAKPTAKPAGKATAKPAGKAAAKPTAKPAGKATAKPAGKATAKPAGKATAKRHAANR